jgi:hypothetical protein
MYQTVRPPSVLHSRRTFLFLLRFVMQCGRRFLEFADSLWVFAASVDVPGRAPDRGLLRQMHGAAPVPAPHQRVHEASALSIHISLLHNCR